MPSGPRSPARSGLSGFSTLRRRARVSRQQWLSVGPSAGGLVGKGEVIAANERVGVVGPQLRLHQLERRLVQRDRLGVPAGGVVGHRRGCCGW